MTFLKRKGRSAGQWFPSIGFARVTPLQSHQKARPFGNCNMSDLSSMPEQQTFKAVLTPHRSLSPSGFLIFMIAIGVVSFSIGIAFLVMGAWPVMGFLGLDVALIYWAFKRNYRDGRMVEKIEVTPHTVQLTKIDPRGNESVLDFNTYWVRLVLDERTDGRSRLSLAMRQEKTLIADFLSDDERREFAEVLSVELMLARSRIGF